MGNNRRKRPRDLLGDEKVGQTVGGGLKGLGLAAALVPPRMLWLALFPLTLQCMYVLYLMHMAFGF